ncbi:MAG: hypothetical protein AAF497_03330 [Planctomycetota bacterium]
MLQNTNWISVLSFSFIFILMTSTSLAQTERISSSTFTSSDAKASEIIPASLVKSKDSVRLSGSSFYNPNTNRLNDLLNYCQVDFAKQPELKNYLAKTKDGIVKRVNYSTSDKDVVCTLDIVEYPPEFLAARKLDIANRPYELLGRQLDTVEKSRAGSKRIYRNRVVNARYPGMELIIAHPNGVNKKSKPYEEGLIHQRSFIREYRVYNLTIAMTKVAYDKDIAASNKVMSDFIDSFNIQSENLKRRFRPPTQPAGIISSKP